MSYLLYHTIVNILCIYTQACHRRLSRPPAKPLVCTRFWSTYHTYGSHVRSLPNRKRNNGGTGTYSSSAPGTQVISNLHRKAKLTMPTISRPHH